MLSLLLTWLHLGNFLLATRTHHFGRNSGRGMGSSSTEFGAFNNDNRMTVPMICVFGRPGAGKTTVAERSIAEVQRRQEQEQHRRTVSESSKSMTSNPVPITVTPLGLDLDVCVPQWMKDNFAKGIYPTLSERLVFSEDICNYIDETLQHAAATRQNYTAQELQQRRLNHLLFAIVSFSFVNTDLRDHFRKRFPQAKWVLIDTTESEAGSRIQQRKGHFYKGAAASQNVDKYAGSPNSGPFPIPRSSDQTFEDSKGKDKNHDNDEWKFAPVSFEHVILDGNNSIDDNADRVVELILELALKWSQKSGEL